MTSLKFLGKYFVSAVCLAILVTPSVAAPGGSDPERGRLDDGRAYRVDDNGYRLVDQLAELEVANDDLKRQLIALENELNSLRGGKSKTKSSVRETNLLPSIGPDAPAPLPPAKTGNKSIGNIGKLDGSGPPNCNQLVSSLYIRVSELERELKQVKSDREALAQRQEVSNLSKIKEEETQLRLKELEAQNGTLQEELGETKRQVAGLRQQLVESEEQVAKVAESKEPRIAEDTDSRAALSNKVEEDEPDAAELSSILTAKNQLRKELQIIQSKIMKRKTLLDSVKKRRRGVSVSAQVLRTRGGVSLDTIRGKVAKLRSLDEVFTLRSGIGEISNKLDEDITVLARLRNGR